MGGADYRLVVQVRQYAEVSVSGIFASIESLMNALSDSSLTSGAMGTWLLDYGGS